MVLGLWSCERTRLDAWPGSMAIRNRVEGDDRSMLTFQAGPNFCVGNGAAADGRYVPLDCRHESPEFERADAMRTAPEATGRPLTPREVSSRWFSRAREEIAGDRRNRTGFSKFSECGQDKKKPDGTICTVGARVGTCISGECVTITNCRHGVDCRDAAHPNGNCIPGVRGDCAGGLVCCAGMAGDGVGYAAAAGQKRRCRAA